MKNTTNKEHDNKEKSALDLLSEEDRYNIEIQNSFETDKEYLTLAQIKEMLKEQNKGAWLIQPSR